MADRACLTKMCTLNEKNDIHTVWPAEPVLLKCAGRFFRYTDSIPMIRRPFVVVRRHLSSTLSNLNISEASRPILIIFYI